MQSVFEMLLSDSCILSMSVCLWKTSSSHFHSQHISDFMCRLKRKMTCYHSLKALLFQPCLWVTYLISSHSMARPQFNNATVGVAHAINTVSSFKASNLEKKVVHFQLVSRKNKHEKFGKFPLLFQTRNRYLPDGYKRSLHIKFKKFC